MIGWPGSLQNLQGCILVYLKDGVSDNNIVDAVGVVHSGVHGDFQPNEY